MTQNTAYVWQQKCIIRKALPKVKANECLNLGQVRALGFFFIVIGLQMNLKNWLFLGLPLLLNMRYWSLSASFVLYSLDRIQKDTVLYVTF